MFILIFTDGYSIQVSRFETHDKAKQAMTEQFNERYRGTDYDELAQSYIDDTDATVVIDGEDRFIWKIISTVTHKHLSRFENIDDILNGYDETLCERHTKNIKICNKKRFENIENCLKNRLIEDFDYLKQTMSDASDEDFNKAAVELVKNMYMVHSYGEKPEGINKEEDL